MSNRRTGFIRLGWAALAASLVTGLAAVIVAEAGTTTREVAKVSGALPSEKSKKSGATPKVSISANPSTVTAGAAVTLSWSAMNAKSCVASGAWVGIRDTSGSASFSDIRQPTTFVLTCSKKGKSGSASVTVNVAASNSGLGGTWTVSEKLSGRSEKLECSDVGVLVVQDGDSGTTGDFRIVGTCERDPKRESVQRFQSRPISLSGQVLEFSVSRSDLSPTAAMTCTYRGTVTDSSPRRISGTVDCESNGPSGSWEATEGNPVPERVDSAAFVNVGEFSSCAITATGDLRCWGANHSGQLGTGDTRPRIVPAASNQGMVFTMVSIAKGGGGHACGITTTGEAYCWGSRGGAGGKLGDGVTGNLWDWSDHPVAVAGARRYVDISVGGDHVCAIATDATAYCWGWNSGGQLGTGNSDPSPVPVPVAGGLKFKSISANIMATCGVTMTGAAYCWGSNNPPGDGSQKGGNQPSLVAGGLEFASISVGLWGGCGVTTGGDGYCWGDNGNGQVGNGMVLNSGLVLTPEKVGGDLKWKSIVSAVFLTCGVTIDDDAYCWGGNFAGERGDGTFDSNYAPLPRKVVGGLKFRSVSADWHVCGVTTDQRAYCWGSCEYGALGDGALRCRNSPTKVAGQP
jgi:alpha-tubulin suppressor-like RCC1 family protein